MWSTVLIAAGVGAAIGMIIAYLRLRDNSTGEISIGVIVLGILIAVACGVVLTRISCNRPREHKSKYVREIQTVEQFNREVLAADLPVLVDLYATWCPPCEDLAPIIERLAEEHQGKVLFVKVNVDNLPSLARKYVDRGIPTVVLLAGGEITSKLIGLQPAEEYRLALFAAIAKRDLQKKQAKDKSKQ